MTFSLQTLKLCDPYGNLFIGLQYVISTKVAVLIVSLFDYCVDDDDDYGDL